MSEEKAIPITQLVRRMRNALEISVGELWVEGEVSNLRRQQSGHYYFSLKDSNAQISCAMFGARRKRGGAILEDGTKVRAFAEVTLYEARGQAQLVVKEVRAAGQGNLQAKFEALKQKLNEEGLFAPALKKPIPPFVQKIAMVTSPTGAALQDMLNVLGRRAPWVEVYVFPVSVQGAGAEEEIAQAIDELSDAGGNGHPVPDVIIVGRGGGSLEDLWNFNEEVVARAIYRCQIPVISAVGHEIDFTISDFAADVRAPTPSAAAELAVPDWKELTGRIDALQMRLDSQVRERIERAQERFASLERQVDPARSERDLRDKRQQLDAATEDLDESISTALSEVRRAFETCEQKFLNERPDLILDRAGEDLARLEDHFDERVTTLLERKRESLNGKESLLRVIGPQATLARGFSMTLNPKGELIASVAQIKKGDKLVTHFSDGKAHVDVTSKRRTKKS